MPTPLPSQPTNTPESAWYELTAVNTAIRGMYSQEIAKITLGIQEARPGVREVMQHAMNSLYATWIQYNQTELPRVANDEHFVLSA